jgi:hypothetical protein
MFFRKMILGRVVAGAALIAFSTLGSSAVARAQTGDREAALTRAATAQQQADAARRRAAELASAGGWAYKTGLVQRNERDAARYQAEADAAMKRAASCPQPAPASPAQSAALNRLTELRQAGGWAYKTGAVARAELDVQALAVDDDAEPVVVSPAQAAALARLAELRQAGGWAYKTGAVARAERDAQALAAPQPTSICGAHHTHDVALASSTK